MSFRSNFPEGEGIRGDIPLEAQEIMANAPLAKIVETVVSTGKGGTFDLSTARTDRQIRDYLIPRIELMLERQVRVEIKLIPQKAEIPNKIIVKLVRQKNQAKSQVAKPTVA